MSPRNVWQEIDLGMLDAVTGGQADPAGEDFALEPETLEPAVAFEPATEAESSATLDEGEGGLWVESDAGAAEVSVADAPVFEAAVPQTVPSATANVVQTAPVTPTASATEIGYAQHQALMAQQALSAAQQAANNATGADRSTALDAVHNATFAAQNATNTYNRLNGT